MNPSTAPKYEVLVHKSEAEGAIVIDYLTGGILTPVDDRPDWAEGLANAIPRERETFYQSRLGDDYTKAESFKTPTAIAFEDLGWLGVDGEGDLVEIDADPEFRNAVVSEFLGVDQDTGEVTREGWHTVAEAEIALDDTRTTDEATLIDEELATGFGGSPVNEAVGKLTKTAS